MSGGGRISIMIEGKEVEQIRSFKYFGSLMTKDERKIKLILEAPWHSVRGMKRFCRKVKKRLVKTLKWTTLLYGCETSFANVDVSKRRKK